MGFPYFDKDYFLRKKFVKKDYPFINNKRLFGIKQRKLLVKSVVKAAFLLDMESSMVDTDARYRCTFYILAQGHLCMAHSPPRPVLAGNHFW